MVDYQLKNGDTFEGKYKILKQLGRGGFGTVYLAYQSSMDRNVALKVLQPTSNSQISNAAKRFHREVKIISKLSHPNTVTIHDFGETDGGILYMVLEYVTGIELKEVLHTEGPIDATRAAQFAKQICKSLAEAHQYGVVHRDLKPANIMVAEFGAEQNFIKVLDFGVASLMDPKTDDLTGVNIAGEKNLIGTPRYMSPEQVHGDVLTGASDIYSLGLILYEMICGQPALTGKSTVAVITQQIDSKPLKLPLLERCHPDLQKIIRTATSKSLRDRFKSASQLSDALETFIFNQKTESREQAEDKTVDQVRVAIPSNDKLIGKSEFLEKGTLVGTKYEIIKPIARGGFSIVYLAKFAGSDLPLAIKILDKNDQLDPIWVARFRREASIIRSFSHPNTVRILDFGEETDFHFIAMEFVPGRSLFKQIKKHGALDARQIAEIILFVCGALEEAHRKGVLHRDLKPSNIMLTETDDGFSAKVLDFGSAKLVDSNPGQRLDRTSQGHAFQQLTQQGVFVGTPRYAAPEQLLQENVDMRVDIYGLGMVMWEALVGDPAVSKLDYASCIELHLGPSPWVLPLSVNTPPEFADIVHRALQKKRENRYQNMAELSGELRNFLETLQDESDFRISISEASDPFFDDAIFGDITGLEHDSDVPLLDEEARITPSSRPTNVKKPKKESVRVTRNLAEPLKLQKPISEVENLELDETERLPKREQAPIQYRDQHKKKKSLVVPYILALALLGGIVFLILPQSSTLKKSVLETIETPEDESQTLDAEFIGSALRSTGWILRQGDTLPYRDGVELRTLIADKRGLKTTISVFECTNAKQVGELEKLSDETTDTIAFGSTFVRWKKSDSGAAMLNRTLFELKKMQKK